MTSKISSVEIGKKNTHITYDKTEMLDRNKVKKTHYLIREANTIYKISIKISLFSFLASNIWLRATQITRDKILLLLTHGLLFPISSKGSLIGTIPNGIAHTKAYITPVEEHRLE